jgi:eukaryotic-like serine/threonine-protein kinase
MPSAFNITAATNDVSLDKSGRGTIALTVSNVSGQPQQGRLSIVSISPTKPEWLNSLDGTDRTFPVGGTQQFTIQIAVPPDTSSGQYTFRPDVVAIKNPDEDSTQGPMLAFEVPKPAPPPPPPPFPWWIPAAAVAVVVVIGVLAYFFFFTVLVPNVVSSTTAAAETAITNAGLQAAPTTQINLTATNDTVLSQNPAFNTRVGRGSTVSFTVARNAVVPPVIGQSFTTAQQLLSQAGLGSAPSSFCFGGNTVFNAAPLPGTKLPPGTTVVLFCL